MDNWQDTPNFSQSLDNREDKLFIENPLDLSSAFPKNTEDEFFHFSSTPLFDSLDHEDVDERIDFSNCGCHDPFTPIFDHNHDPITVDFSKPSIYDDLFDDEVETPNTVKALQPELMVMSGPHSPEVGLTSNQEIVQSPKAPHHPSVCIEDQSHTYIMLTPLELHNPIAHALEEYYIESTCARHKLSLFIYFTCMSQPGAFICFKVACSHSTVVSPQISLHTLELTYVPWTSWSMKCGCLHFYIFLSCWFA